MATTASSMASALRSMNLNELNALRDLIVKEETDRKKEVRETYGEWFSNIVGVDRIFQLVKVEAKDLNLEAEGKYPQGVVRPSMLKDLSAVRGLTGWKRPFIAIKVEVLEPETKKVVGVFVELIFKRYGLDGDGKPGSIFEDNYVTALSNSREDGTRIESCLYCAGGMTSKQITAVRELLEGKEIEAVAGPKYLLRMVQ